MDLSTNTNLTSTEMNPTTVNFDNLIPALVSCFGIIFLGYLSGRMNLISETELKGMNTFVRVFVLPSLIFVNMVKMDLATVNWYFLLGILIAKSVIFIGVIVIYVLIFGCKGIATGGLIAIFCTQSNDFALGYPIVEALYHNSHPDFASYMYLIAPVNLAILNPIAFFMIETRTISDQMARIRGSFRGSSVHLLRCIYVMNVLKKIYSNPIIFMTVLGILANFVFQQNLPEVLNSLLTSLGQAFSACALFALGMRMVGKLTTLSGAKLITPCLLILVKLLVLPLITREIISILNVGENPSDSLDWSTFGFLYGTIPAAPTIFVFAVAYNLEIDLVATTMVACTFVSGPWMFISAKMITLTNISPSKYVQQLGEFMCDVSIISLCASIWVLLVFLLTKRGNKIPHKFVACLTISQILSCIGAILYRYLDLTQEIPNYIQFFFFTTGIYSGRIWTAIIAITLLFLESRSLCFVIFKLQPAFYFFGWVVPAVLSILLLVFDKTVPGKDANPNFAYGTFQAIVAVFLLVLCFIVSAGCLVLYEMHKKQRDAEHRSINTDEEEIIREGNESSEDEDLLSETESNQSKQTVRITPNDTGSVSGDGNGCGLKNCCNSSYCTSSGKEQLKVRVMPTIPEVGGNSRVNSQVVDIEDLFAEDRTSDKTNLIENGGDSRRFGPARTRNLSTASQDCPSGLVCTTLEGDPCQGILLQYQEPIDEDLDIIEEEPAEHDPQIFRHYVLIIILLSSMLVGLAVAIWTLVMEQMSGIYVELSFLDASLNFGQSIVVLVIFGIDNKYVLLPLMKKLRKLWYKDDKLLLPMQDELSQETRSICEQFKKHHLDKCVLDIAGSQIYRLQEYQQVFTGRRLVDWLLEVGLAHDRMMAVNYARHLVEGRLLRHIKSVYHFYDRNLLYTFN